MPRWFARLLAYLKGTIMAGPAVTLTLDKASYAKGETIVATYKVTGADPITGTGSGKVNIDGAELTAQFTVQINHLVQFFPPAFDGLTFVVDRANPAIWRATA